MDRYLVAGALILLSLEVSYLLMGLEDPTNWSKLPGIGASSTKPIGEMQETANQVRRRGQNSLVWSESQAADTLFENDSVLTLSGSTAQIKLQGDTRLNLDENTLIVLEPQPGTDKNASLRIRFSQGSLRSADATRPLKFENESWTLSAEQGSTLSLTRLDDGRFSVEMEKGEAKLEGEKGTQTINRGEKVLIRENTIEEKRRLSEEITWSELIPSRIYSRTFPIDVPLRWKGKASGLQVIDPQKKLASRPLPTGSTTETNLNASPGTYVLALEAGKDLSPSRTLQIREAPSLRYFAPLPRDRVVAGTETVFAWEPLKIARRYRLEISETPEFARVLQAIDAVESQVRLGLKNEGAYYWRVVSFDEDQVLIPAPRVYPFYVVPDPLSSPDLQAPEIRAPAEAPGETSHWFFRLFLPPARAESKVEAVFRWSEVQGADHYVIEISETPGFEEPLVIERTLRPRFNWKNFKRGRYFWRVAAGQSVRGRGDRLGLFSSPAMADLESTSKFAGEGVTVSVAAGAGAAVPAQVVKKKETPIVFDEPPAEPIPDPLPKGVESVAVSPTPLPEPSPRPMPPPEPPKSRPTALDDSRSVPGRFAWVPQYRSTRTDYRDSISGDFKGPLLVAFDAELNFHSGESNLWEWRFGFEQSTWRPEVAGFQRDLKDTRWRTELLYRPSSGNWAYGFGAQTLLIFEREAPESGVIRHDLGFGPSLRYTDLFSDWRQLDLDLSARMGATLFGARASGVYRFYFSRQTNLLWYAGPGASLGWFTGAESRRLRELSIGAELGINW